MLLLCTAVTVFVYICGLKLIYIHCNRIFYDCIFGAIKFYFALSTSYNYNYIIELGMLVLPNLSLHHIQIKLASNLDVLQFLQYNISCLFWLLNTRQWILRHWLHLIHVWIILPRDRALAVIKSPITEMSTSCFSKTRWLPTLCF